MFVINVKLKKYIKHMWGRKNGNSKHFLLPLSVLNTTTDLSFLTSLRPPCWSNLKTDTTFELIISLSTKPLKIFRDWSSFLRRPPRRSHFLGHFIFFVFFLRQKWCYELKRKNSQSPTLLDWNSSRCSRHNLCGSSCRP
jgi:hypothetical protein